METRAQYDVIVVGAGAAGLAAASLLVQQHQRQALILEALDRPGSIKRTSVAIKIFQLESCYFLVRTEFFFVAESWRGSRLDSPFSLGRKLPFRIRR
jgi:flavin-dependent dehydrogenase